MKKIIILILISSLILGCKTKRVLKNESKTISSTEYSEVKKESKKESVSWVIKSDQNKNESKANEIKNKSVEITGIVDDKNPLIYYNIVNGDTIDLFKVSGNANVIYKNNLNTQNSIQNSNSITNTENKKEFENTISNTVNSALKKVDEIKTKTVEVVKKDFTIGTYVIWFFWGLAIIVAIVIIMWIRKPGIWKSIINKINSKL